MSHMDSSDDDYEMLHATPAETAQWKKLEQQKKLWKIQTKQLEVLKVREKVISEMQENDCFQRELLKKKDEENAELKRTIMKMQQRSDDEEKRKETEERRRGEEMKLIDSMTGMLEIEMDWMDRKRNVKTLHVMRKDEEEATTMDSKQPIIRSIADVQCDSVSCANSITILNSAFICVTCSLLSNLLSIITSIVTMQYRNDSSIDGGQGEDEAKQEEAMIYCAYLLVDIISLLSFITHCPLFMAGKVVVETLRLLLALIDDRSLTINFHVVCLAVAVLWWRNMGEMNARLKVAREHIKCCPAPAAELAEDPAAIAA